MINMYVIFLPLHATKSYPLGLKMQNLFELISVGEVNIHIVNLSVSGFCTHMLIG